MGIHIWVTVTLGQGPKFYLVNTSVVLPGFSLDKPQTKYHLSVGREQNDIAVVIEFTFRHKLCQISPPYLRAGSLLQKWKLKAQRVRRRG